MTNIEHIVMRRVHRIHRLRYVISGQMLAALLVVAALYGIGREVWVARVFENAPHSLPQLSHFYLYAFEHTRLVVQALTLLTIASVIYLARETAKLITVCL